MDSQVEMENEADAQAEIGRSQIPTEGTDPWVKVELLRIAKGLSAPLGKPTDATDLVAKAEILARFVEGR